MRRYTDNWAAVITSMSCPKGQPDAVNIWWVSFWMRVWVSPLVHSYIHYCLQFILWLHWTGQTMWSDLVYRVLLVDMITIFTGHCTPCPWSVSLSDIVIRTLPMTCDRTNPRKQYSKTERTTFYQMKLSALFGIIVRFMIKWKFL